MNTDGHRFKKITLAILTLLLVCAIWFYTMPAGAVQTGAKSTGLTQIGKIEDLEQVRQILLEHARAIDFIHRQLLGDIDTINRDEIPHLQDQIDGLDLSVDFDLPLMEGITWSVDGGVPKWTAGTIRYGETTYAIDAWSSGDTTASTRGIYWTLTSEGTGKLQTKFYGQNSPDYYPNRWFVAFFDGTNLYPAVQSTIIHGGLIQASTITADKIQANTFVSVGGAAADVNAGATTINGGKITANTLSLTSLSDKSLANLDSIADTKLAGIESGADKTSTHTSNNTSNVGWLSASTCATYASLAGTGLDSNGYAKKLLSSTKITETWNNGNDSGLYMGGTYLGFWNTTSDQWTAYIKNDGTFYFGGDATNYLNWNGSTLTLRGILNASDITAGNLDADIITAGKITLKDGSTLPIGDSGTANYLGGTFTCDSLTAKKNVQVGPDNSDTSFNIKVDASNVARLRCNYKGYSGINFYGITSLDSNGLKYRLNKHALSGNYWPTTDGTRDADPSDGTGGSYVRVRIGGNDIYDYDAFIHQLDTTECHTDGLCIHSQTGTVVGIAGGIMYYQPGPTSGPGYFISGVRNGSNTLVTRYLPHSSGTTGSAAAASGYVELQIGGTIYKLLHCGTASP